MTIHHALLLGIASFTACLMPACQSVPSAEERAAERSKIDAEREVVLQKLYAIYPETKKQMDEAYGSAVFSGTNIFVIFGGGSGAEGVATDKSGKKTYMSMSEASAGIGLGGKGFYIVCLFDNDLDYRNFTEKGWSFNARADAAAKGTDDGEAGNVANTSGVWKYYEITKDGALLQAAVGVRKFWPDEHLNN
ncbi:MAG: hypothetical protein FJ254_03475 [Phycisphaerae bacterium]|nr:hypothetical protein [Phycisphaerae bacterium]